MFKKFIFFIFSILSSLCFADISVESRLCFNCSQESPSLFIEMINKGDELADKVELVPMAGSVKGEALSIGILRPNNMVGCWRDISEKQANDFLKSNCCMVYPFMLNYQDRFGNEFSSCVLAKCENEHNLAVPEDLNFQVSSACVANDQATSEMAISVFYDYDKAVAAGANEIRILYYLPNGISPLENNVSNSYTRPLKESGIEEIGLTLRIDVENIVGHIPYVVIAQFYSSDGKAISQPLGISEHVYVETSLDYSTFPQLLNKSVLIYVVVFCLIILFIKIFKPKYIRKLSDRTLCIIEWLVVLCVTIYIGKMLQLPLALEGNTCMGGDLPAHHYLVSHISETGQPVSWADGWWCGFPMFHYYFPLPYTILAFLSNIFPHNIIFNLGVCLGLLMLPFSVYLSARIVRMPRPLPAVATCFVLPLVFDNTHNMWGVNAYSTLAGMVANSWSFCLFCPALANICRDIYDNKFRLRTPLLIAAVALSHFFTSIILAIVVGVILLCVIGYSIRKKTTHYRIPIYEGGLAIMLVAWWLIPLATSSEWSVAFGSQWEISFFKQLPNIVIYFFLPLLVIAVASVIYCRKQDNRKLYLWFVVFALLFLVALVLFYFGRSIEEVFVNCRLWPFIAFSLLFIMAGLLAYAFREFPVCGMLLALALCFSFAWNDKEDDKNEIWSYLNLVPTWAKYNFSGYENSPSGDAAQELIEYLRSVEPCGRIAYDLNPYNESLGSTRFFEALPALTGHPIIEGGIVNSAIGSLTAYTVQGEMSEHTAGAPLLVKPQNFNPERGLAHLELLGVRRFIAHSTSTIDAMDCSNGIWQKERVIGGGKWILYKHRRQSNGLVRKWNIPINFYVSDNFQKDSLEWMYAGAAVREPFAFVKPTIPHQLKLDYPYSRLEKLKKDPTPVEDWISDLAEDIPSKVVKNGSRYEIHFKATELNSPYIVAMSYFPNWKVRGATGPFYVTPGFMLVYPTSEDVCIYYGYSSANILGYIVTAFGVAVVFVIIICRCIHKIKSKKHN